MLYFLLYIGYSGTVVTFKTLPELFISWLQSHLTASSHLLLLPLLSPALSGVSWLSERVLGRERRPARPGDISALVGLLLASLLAFPWGLLASTPGPTWSRRAVEKERGSGAGALEHRAPHTDRLRNCWVDIWTF